CQPTMNPSLAFVMPYRVYARLTLPPSCPHPHLYLFFFNDTATPEIYTLSLHDALPISETEKSVRVLLRPPHRSAHALTTKPAPRSEEHTSELQSLTNLVCRLLLEKKKTTHNTGSNHHAVYDRHSVSQS